MFVLLVLILLVFTGNVDLMPTFKIGMMVHSQIWPEITMTNDTVQNDVVRLDISGHDVIGSQVMHTVCEMMASSSLDGVILLVDCHIAAVLEQQSVFRHIPSIVVTRNFCRIDGGYLFPLRPSCSNVNFLLSDIAKYNKWHDILVFHDNTYESHCLVDLVRQLSLKSVMTRIAKTGNYAEPGQYLHFLSKYLLDGVLVLGNRSTITDILRQATSYQVRHNSWILMSDNTNFSALKETNINNGNIVFLKQQFKNYTSHDGTCDDIYSLEMESVIYLSESKSWLLDMFSRVVSQHDITSLEPLSCHQQMQKPNRTVVMDTAKIMSQENEHVFQACSTVANSNGSLKHMGQWMMNDGLKLENAVLFENKFVDFGYRRLRVAALPLPPFVIFTTDETTNKTIYSGFCIDILNQLALKFKFSYEIVSPADNSYGSLEEDGTWNGMVGMVMRKEADFAAGPFTITWKRESVIDFTSTYMEEGVGIITKRPQEESNKKYKMFKPLSVMVWIGIGITIILIGICLCIVNRFSPFADNTDDENKDMTNSQIASSSMWLIYGAFVEQASDPRPRSASGRIMLSFWWIFTILMLSTYTANLAAYLTVNIIESPINSLGELAEQDEIKPLIFSGSNLHTLFKTAKSQVYHQLWVKMNGMPTVNELDVALKYVRQDQYAFLTDYSLLEYVMLQDCQIYAVADEKFNNAGLGFVLQENSSYLEAFNLAIMKMSEAGFIEQWRQKWWPRSDSCSSSDRSGSSQSLGLDSVLGLFYLYSSVVAVALVMFMFELFCQITPVNKWLSSLKTKIKCPNVEPMRKTSCTASQKT